MRILVLLAVAVALVVGFALGGATDGLGYLGTQPVPEPAAAPPAAASVPAHAGAPPPAGSAAPATLTPASVTEAEVVRLRGENQALAARVAELERSVAAAGGGAPAQKRGPTFSFGALGRMDAVVQADWQEMAQASRVVSDSIARVYRDRLAGRTTPDQVWRDVQENTEKVRKYEYRTVDRMPTAAVHNGELSHPITQTNLVAAVLAEAGKPLSAEQVAQIERLGSAFDDDFARTRAGWNESVTRVRRVLEEYRLKGRFTDALFAALTEEQRALLVDPSMRSIAGLDLYDPTLMVVHSTVAVTGDGPATFRTKLGAILRGRVGLEAAAPAPRLDALVDAFVARTQRIQEPVVQAQVRNWTYAQGLVAGEATVDLVDGILREIDLTAHRRSAIFDDATWYIPRTIKTA